VDDIKSGQRSAVSSQEKERVPAFSVRNVAYKYPDGTPALIDINLEVRKGEFIGLLGANVQQDNPASGPWTSCLKVLTAMYIWTA